MFVFRVPQALFDQIHAFVLLFLREMKGVVPINQIEFPLCCYLLQYVAYNCLSFNSEFLQIEFEIFDSHFVDVGPHQSLTFVCESDFYQNVAGSRPNLEERLNSWYMLDKLQKLFSKPVSVGKESRREYIWENDVFFTSEGEDMLSAS